MALARSLRSFYSNLPRREAQEWYIALVSQSRKPFFYTECAVPDTLDGRFEIILLHVFLTLRFLKGQGRDDLSRRLQEALFDDMDRNLREMGVGDMGVAKRVKTMSKAAYGRLEAYTKAFADEQALKEVLVRNVYRGVEPAARAIQQLVAYTLTYYIADYVIIDVSAIKARFVNARFAPRSGRTRMRQHSINMPTEVWYSSASLSSASRMRMPREFRYFFTPAPRAALLARSFSERYLPERNPLASE